MIRFATAIVGHLHGGLALGGVWRARCSPRCPDRRRRRWSRSARFLLPAMVKQGYPKKFGVGVIGTARGALGILIPPSIVMVIYAVSTQLVDRPPVHRRHHPDSCWPALLSSSLVVAKKAATTRALHGRPEGGLASSARASGAV